MDLDKLVEELNSYEKGVVQKVVKGKRQELIKGVPTTFSELIFYNGSVANIRVTKNKKVVSIEYLGRVILDYDEVSLNVKAKAKQLIKMVLKSEASEKVVTSKFMEKTPSRISNEKKKLQKESNALDKKIEEVKKELLRYKEEII